MSRQWWQTEEEFKPRLEAQQKSIRELAFIGSDILEVGFG